MVLRGIASQVSCYFPYNIHLIKSSQQLYRCAQLPSRVRHFVTPWMVTSQAPLSLGILQARILEWVACPPPGDLPNPEIEPRSPVLQADCLPSDPPWSYWLSAIVLTL